MYEGRFIDMLQNGIILLIFKNKKMRNIGFVRNLTGHILWHFYEDDFMKVSNLKISSCFSRLGI